MNTEGNYFLATLGALALNGEQQRDTRRNAADIVRAVIAACGGTEREGINPVRFPNRPATGLVYGRIQSGKTRAMIASTAMAFDNKFRISVVMTSNINDLVSQTHIDFARGLPGIMAFTKDSDLEREVAGARLHMERGDGRLLLICSKGGTSLRNISQFLSAIGADRYPAIIFDDEGDQASLDTNTRRRSRGVAVGPSAINDIIQNTLRPALPKHAYVSVTGTPQAVLLQSADSSNRPSFIRMLPPGASYVGGDRFFATDDPEDNPALIALVARNEQQQLLNPNQPIPAGLRSSILFFLVSAASALRNLAPPERGYSYLCHPSLRNDEQATAETRVNDFLNEVYGALLGVGGGREIIADLRAAHAQLATTLGNKTPTFENVTDTMKQYLPGRRLLVINARVKRQGIDYGQGLNFLIGGNTLGRGIAIRDLLVTYYVRDSRMSQIDTMHQHARMYGYRSATLAYTRLFVPAHLYFRFRDIHNSDEELRAFIEDHLEELASTFPVEVAFNLRATRPGVLDVGKIDTLEPGKHVYPNCIVLPQDMGAHARVLRQLRNHFSVPNGTPEQIEQAARRGIEIDAAAAIALVAPIRTRSRNTWRDSTVSAVIEKVAEKLGNRVLLRFRRADRTVREGGFISTGTLSGPELTAARAAAIPTLWIMAARTRRGSTPGEGLDFMYPTLVIPDSFPSLFIFNRGA